MIYSISGKGINNAYNHSGIIQESAYDIDGNKVHYSPQPKDPYLSGRLLLFEDDFRETTLNRDYWRPEVGHIRGNQSDFYTASNVYIENEKLVLLAKYNRYLSYDWTIGSVTGVGMKSWMFGRFEAKMKCPRVDGNNTAFWCMPNFTRQTYTNEEGVREYITQVDGFYTPMDEYNWTYASEIDIVETLGTNNNPQCNLWDNWMQSFGFAELSQSIDVEQWHIYSMEWTDTYIAMFVDGIEYKRWTFADYSADRVRVFKEYPQSIILGTSINNMGTDTKAYVDWVRVYAPQNVQSKIVETAIHIQPTLELKKGYRGYMVPSFTPFNTSDQTVVWRSDNESIAQCDHGLVLGINTGQTTIYAISPNNYASACVVTVVEPS